MEWGLVWSRGPGVWSGVWYGVGALVCGVGSGME